MFTSDYSHHVMKEGKAETDKSVEEHVTGYVITRYAAGTHFLGQLNYHQNPQFLWKV